MKTSTPLRQVKDPKPALKPVRVKVIPPFARERYGVKPSQDAREIELDRICPDADQPRKEFDHDALERLASSLKARGQLQPIRVRWVEAIDHYVIICGERRWRAAMLAELPSLTAIIHDGPLGASDISAIQVVENALREDLAPLEEAEAYRSLMKVQKWSQSQLARELGVHKSKVSRALALLDYPDGLRNRVAMGTLSPAVARELARVEDAGQREILTLEAIRMVWTVLEVGQAVDLAIGRAVEVGRESVAPCNKPDPGEVLHHATKPARAPVLPCWQDAPITGLSIPSNFMKALVDAEVETAGEAWMLIESGWMRSQHGWKIGQCHGVAYHLERFRESQGDPAVMHIKFEEEEEPVGQGTRATDRASRATCAPIEDRPIEALTVSWPDWSKTRYDTTDEATVATSNVLDVVVRSHGGTRPTAEIRAALEVALAEVLRREDLEGGGL